MWTEERLNKMLTTPSEALSGELGRLEGDILVLGAGGKMGPTLCVLAKNALRAAGVDWGTADGVTAGLLSYSRSR